MKFASMTTGLNRWSRQWEVQPAPFSHPLPYSFSRRVESQYPAYNVPQGEVVNDAAYTLTSTADAPTNRLVTACKFGARNNAVAKMKGDAQAQLGLMLATWEQTSSLIVSAYESVVDTRPKKFEHEGIRYRQKILKRLYERGSVSNYYLMTIFGIIPAANDLASAAKVLSKPFPVSRTSVRRSDTSTTRVTGGSYRGSVYTEVGVQVGGTVRVTNPKLSFANDLGLINLASIAWDTVPFSFLVNMVCPIGAFLNSLTDLVGYEVLDGYTTTFVKKTFNGEVLYQPRAGATNVWGSRFVRQISVTRELGVPSPQLPPVRCPEPTLFATTMALSLLDQKLGAIKHIVEAVSAEHPGKIGRKSRSS